MAEPTLPGRRRRIPNRPEKMGDVGLDCWGCCVVYVLADTWSIERAKSRIVEEVRDFSINRTAASDGILYMTEELRPPFVWGGAVQPYEDVAGRLFLLRMKAEGGRRKTAFTAKCKDRKAAQRKG